MDYGTPTVAARPHQRMQVWKDAIVLVERIYLVSAGFPDSERFGLSSQMRRASVSVASNIAEGAGRGSTAEYLRFLTIARGSLSELDTQLEIAKRLGYLADDAGASLLLDQAFHRLNALIRSIRERSVSEPALADFSAEPDWDDATLVESLIPNP